MLLALLQRRAVDSIKRHALVMSLRSPRAQAAILTEYLWGEEGAESSALQKTAAAQAIPPWLGKLVTRQLADEARHAQLLRARLAELGAQGRPPPALAKAKLWWLERACAPFQGAFAAGPIVVMLAVAAQLEATGVRVFGRHLAVLEEHAAGDPLAAIVRSILSDEQRHAKSCAAAVEKLVHTHEREALSELRERIAQVDRSFGITIALGYWVLVASRALRDRTEATS
jgi:hypothetical protein